MDLRIISIVAKLLRRLTRRIVKRGMSAATASLLIIEIKEVQRIIEEGVKLDSQPNSLSSGS